MIAVSAVSLLLIVTLITVIIIQCLLILRMRKSKDVLHSSNETYAESSMNVDVPTTPNEAYTQHKITRPSEEVTYEIVKCIFGYVVMFCGVLSYSLLDS